jgi:hypothetical protein
MVKLILKIRQRIASADFKLETLKRIKHSVKITIQVLGLSLITFVLLAFFIAIFGESLGSMLVCKNPFTSGFVHFEIEHLFYNLLLIFLFTLPKQNTHYDIQKLFWITFIISCIYLPICLLGLTHYSLENILKFYADKYPDNSQFRALMSLTYFEDAEEQFMPEMLVAIDWDRIKSFIIDKVATLSL